MANAPSEFVNGYTCPFCNVESIGVPIVSKSAQRLLAWDFRLQVHRGFRLRCFNCGLNVPREYWSFAVPLVTQQRSRW